MYLYEADRMRIRGVFIPLAFLVLSLAFTWPLAADLGGSLGGGLDPQLQSWILAWDTHALRTNPLGVWQAPIFFPYPDTLAYTDHHLLLSLLVAPIIWATGNPALAHNLLVILSYALSGYAVYLLAKEMWGEHTSTIDIPAFVAGVAFAFSSFRMAQFVHLQMLQTAWLPLALLFLMRTLRGARWRDGLLCGLFFTIQCVTALYFAYFAVMTLGLYIGLWVLWVLWQRLRYAHPLPWAVLPRLAAGALLAIAIVIPLTLPYLRVYQSIGVVRSPRELENWSAPLQSYIAIDPGNWLFGRVEALQATGGEFALFPGLVVSLLALIGVLGRGRGDKETGDKETRRQGDAPTLQRSIVPTLQRFNASMLQCFLLLLALLAFVLSLGTVLRLVRGGDVLPVPLPYSLLYERLPGFGALRVPARWGMLVSLAACLLAARGLLVLGSKARRQGDDLGEGNNQSGKSTDVALQCSPKGYPAPMLQCSNAPPLPRWVLAIQALALVLILAESVTTLPLTRAPSLASAPPIYAWLGEPGQADIHTVLELPAGRTQRGAELEKTMLRQYYGILHWKPLVAGYSGLIPFGTTDLLGRAQQLPDAKAIQFLQLAGIDTLVIHNDEYDPSTLAKLRNGLDVSPLMRKRAEVGDASIYTIAPFVGNELPRGATLLLTSDERAPGITALALAQGWAKNGVWLYGAGRIRYYGQMADPMPGQVFDYGLLADTEDPHQYGFALDRQIWHAGGLALYARDPALLVNLEPGIVPTGRFHPEYPATLDIRLNATDAQIGGQLVRWTQPITSAVVELDVASLVEQQLATPAGPLAIPLGSSSVAFAAIPGQPIQIIGQADATAIVRVRIRAGTPQQALLREPGLACAVESHFMGSRLEINVRAAGSGSLLIEARGAAASDDHPIALFSGIQPIAPDGYAAWSFSTDLLMPNEPWQQQKSEALDGRYIVYVKDPNHPGAPGMPIAQYRVRGGQVVDAQPVSLPLMALP